MTDHDRPSPRIFLALWIRLYMACLGLTLLGGLVALVWFIWLGPGYQSIVLAAIALIPFGLTGALAMSLPLALIWTLVARIMGWKAVPAGSTMEIAHQCERCSYDVSGLTQSRCPECGRELERESSLS